MSKPNEVTLEDAPDEITRAFEEWRVEMPSRTVGYFHGDEVGIAQAAFRAGYEKARAAVSVAATVSELTPEEIAQEFNRRAWRGREDWERFNAPAYSDALPDVIALLSKGRPYEPRTVIQIEDARALLAGWRAQEELAALKAADQPSYHISTEALANLVGYWGKRAAKDGLGPWYDMDAFEAMLDLQRARLQLAALTAEVERLKASNEDLNRLSQQLAVEVRGD